MPKISIIVPTYNESQNLPLLFSDLSIDNDGIEIIIVDCNSTDKTRDIAYIYRTNIYKSFSKTRKDIC